MRRPLAERLEGSPELRVHDPINLDRKPNGKSTVDIRCPFCSQVARRVLLAQLTTESGKRCTGCGALHLAHGRTRGPRPKKHQKGGARA